MARATIARQSFVGFGTRRLQALCDVAGLSGRRKDAAALFRTLLGAWGELPIGAEPASPSDITDDHTPFELSIALEDGRPEVRMLVEAQPERPSLFASWEAAMALSRELERHHGAALGRLHTIEDLFAPKNPWARFAMWHAASIGPSGPPSFKVYLNPESRGVERAPWVVKEALMRLGLFGAWSTLSRAKSTFDDLKYFSLDLSAQRGARVKVYLAHHHATSDRIEEVLRLGRSHMPGDGQAFCRAMGGHDGPFSDRPVLTCLSFTEGDHRPSTVTVHFPIRAYAGDDRTACDRVLAFLPRADRRLYEEAIEAVATRPLEDGVGIQTYASFRRQGATPRLTVYLATEAYQVRPPVEIERPSILAPPPSLVVRAGAPEGGRQVG